VNLYKFHTNKQTFSVIHQIHDFPEVGSNPFSAGWLLLLQICFVSALKFVTMIGIESGV
jgi:hypothetical protein